MPPITERHTTKVFVGYRHQFVNFCKSEGIRYPGSPWKHVDSPHQLMGMRVDQVKVAPGFNLSLEMTQAIDYATMHNAVTTDDCYRIGEHFGALREKMVKSVTQMSSWSEEDAYPRIYVCYTDGSKELIDREEVRALRMYDPPPLRLWYEPNCSSTCMWCGKKVADDDMEAHEEACGGWS